MTPQTIAPLRRANPVTAGYLPNKCEPSGRRDESQRPLHPTFRLLNQTVLPLLPSLVPAQARDPLPERIQAFVTSNLGNRITLKELARFLGYSEKYSSEFFQLQMGTCFSDYLKRLRIVKAKHMLIGDEATVTHIAEVLGFSDSFAFSHFFKRVVGHPGPIGWAPPMADSYLIGQVVVDRAIELSREPEHERVIVLGFGATDPANERSMHDDLDKLVDYLSRYQRFRESRALVYYDRAAPRAEEKNAAADAVMTQMAAKKGRTHASSPRSARNSIIRCRCLRGSRKSTASWMWHFRKRNSCLIPMCSDG